MGREGFYMGNFPMHVKDIKHWSYLYINVCGMQVL